MSSGRSLHTALGESIRDFVSEVEGLTQRIASLDLSSDPSDELSLRRAAHALEEAHAQLVSAREDLKAREEELRELLEFERIRYRALFESAPDAYLVTDQAGTILEANSAAEALLGAPRDYLRGKPLPNLVHAEERRPFRVLIGRMRTVETATDWEVVMKRRKGTDFPASVTVSAFRDANGEVTSLRWLIRDFTERRQLEERTLAANVELERRVAERTAEVEAAGGRLEAVVRQIPAAIIVVDLPSQEVVPANEEARRLLLAVSGTTQPPLEDWVETGGGRGGQQFHREERPLVKALEGGETVFGAHIEFDLREGGRAIYELSAAPVHDAAGNLIAAVAAYWDITERERRAQAERDFVTNAAHELRTPLTALASSVEILQSGAKDDPVQRERFLAHVEMQCTRLQQLVHSLLVLARAQTGQAAEAEEIGVATLLDDIAADAPAGRIRFELGCPGTARVRANRELAGQALRNLVSNAVKYAPEGEIVVKGGQSGDFVSLEVVDAGPGISAAERRRVVERFYRGRNDADGFGLGLTIASQAAEAMQGRLEIESEEGRGTTARLLLPAGNA